MGDELIGLLGGCIQGLRGICKAVFRKNTTFLIAINRTGGSKEKASNALLTTSFDNIHKSHEIAFGIFVWRIQTIAYTRLSCQVYNQIRWIGGKQTLQIITLANVDRRKTEIGETVQQLKSVLFNLCGIITIHRIDAKDLKARCQKSFSHMKAYKSGHTGYQNLSYFSR